MPLIIHSNPKLVFLKKKALSKYIYNLIEEGEHQKQDFKFGKKDCN